MDLPGSKARDDPSAQPAYGRRIRRAVWADLYRTLVSSNAKALQTAPRFCAANLRARGDENRHARLRLPQDPILPDAEGRKMVRATVVNQRTRATMTIWEYIDGARVLESNFVRFRRTRFSVPLKQFLLADLDADVVARLIENGGYEARLTERYRELLTDLELRLASSFSTPAPRDRRRESEPCRSETPRHSCHAYARQG